ncbi:hypothetical protein AB4351_20825, partial [Vibrio sp. 10N.261.51.F11]|uniref:hypothetical protein n=1 Tax=Vibrio sp. 10N.261.51.F11 TaxID=3229678 RepID=UPI003552FCAD
SKRRRALQVWQRGKSFNGVSNCFIEILVPDPVLESGDCYERQKTRHDPIVSNAESQAVFFHARLIIISITDNLSALQQIG